MALLKAQLAGFQGYVATLSIRLMHLGYLLALMEAVLLPLSFSLS
jgi:hypothetical protein